MLKRTDYDGNDDNNHRTSDSAIRNDAWFSGCISLESFDFPNLKKIENSYTGVFQGCTSLKSVILPQGLASIGEKAFMDCTSLESITIPASILFIGNENHIEDSSVFITIEQPKLIRNIRV